MLHKPHNCSGCPLYGTGRGFSTAEGPGSIKVLLVGEALDESAAIEGLPFRPFSQAGSILQRTINDLGYRRDEFAITTLVRCRPPYDQLEGTQHELDAIARCSTYLNEVIAQFQPRVIVALGGLPLKALTGLSGKKRGVNTLRGYVLRELHHGLPLIPTYAPGFIARGQKNFLGVIARDIQKAVKISRGELIEGRDFYLNPQKEYPNDYTLNATVPQVNQALRYLRSHRDLPFGYDLETAESVKTEDEDEIEFQETRITQFQISWAKGHAMVMPAESYSRETFYEIMREFLKLPNPKLDFNGWGYDVPLLKKHGIDPGPTIDLLPMFRHWQPDCPGTSHAGGLQYSASFFNFPFPWKHLAGDDLPFYGAADVDSLHWIYNPLKSIMQKEGIW